MMVINAASKAPFTPSASTRVYVRRRTYTRVDGRTRASTSVDARRATDVDGRTRARCEWGLTVQFPLYSLH